MDAYEIYLEEVISQMERFEREAMSKRNKQEFLSKKHNEFTQLMMYWGGKKEAYMYALAMFMDIKK